MSTIIDMIDCVNGNTIGNGDVVKNSLSDICEADRKGDNITFPKNHWIDGSLHMIFLGRFCCKARKRTCNICPLHDICGGGGGESPRTIVSGTLDN